MATKKSTEKKNQSATTKKATARKGAQVTNGTRVVCPECGAEFDVLADHEHMVTGMVIGKDSDLGTLYLPVSKRSDALKAADIDPAKYFSIQLPTGGEQMMKMDESGKAVPVTSDDPIIAAILSGGTVPNRNLFRRWIMSQVFHWLMDDEKYGAGTWLSWHGYAYQWDMLLEELRVQAKLYGRDPENFAARNRWFNKDLAVGMADDYIRQVEKDCRSRKQRKCHGLPYIKFSHRDVFVADIHKKILWPLTEKRWPINHASTPEELYERVKNFRTAMYFGEGGKYKQFAAWKDAYKGMGAYATMQNLLRFHGCEFPQDNEFYSSRLSGLKMLEKAADSYSDEGWRLFGLMKQMLAYNHIDIAEKMKQWAAAKEARSAAK